MHEPIAKIYLPMFDNPFSEHELYQITQTIKTLLKKSVADSILEEQKAMMSIVTRFGDTLDEHTIHTYVVERYNVGIQPEYIKKHWLAGRTTISRTTVDSYVQHWANVKPTEFLTGFKGNKAFLHITFHGYDAVFPLLTPRGLPRAALAEILKHGEFVTTKPR